MSPCHIENTIKAACGLIGAMMTVGDDRPYNTALIVLDADTASAYAARKGLADASPQALAGDPEVIAQIATGVGRGNAKLVPRGTDQAVQGATGLLGARRGRNHAHHEAQTQTGHAEVCRRHRGTVRGPTRFNGARTQLSHAASDFAKRGLMRTTSGHDQVASSWRSRVDPLKQQRWAALASTRPAPLTEFAVNTVGVLSRAAPAASHCRSRWTRPVRFPRNLGCSVLRNCVGRPGLRHRRGAGPVHGVARRTARDV